MSRIKCCSCGAESFYDEHTKIVCVSCFENKPTAHLINPVVEPLGLLNNIESSMWEETVHDVTAKLTDFISAQQNASGESLDSKIEKCAMAIVHNVGESLGADVKLRQSTNDSNIDFAISKIKELINVIKT